MVRHLVLMVTVLAMAGKQADAAPACRTGAPTDPVRVQASRSDTRWVGQKIFRIAPSPDGRLVAAQVLGGAVAIWQADSLLPLWFVHGEPGQLSWSDAGDRLYQTRFATGETMQVSLADGSTSIERAVRVASHRADAPTIVVSDRGLELRDPQDRATSRLAWPNTRRKLDELVAARDGSLIAGVVSADAKTATTSQLVVWTRDGKGREMRIDRPNAEIAGIDAAHDRLLVSTSTGVLWVDATGRAAPRKLDLEGGAVLSPNADAVAFLKSGDVGIYDLTSNRVVWRKELGNTMDSARAVAFDAHGGSLFATGGTPLTRLELTAGHVIAQAGSRRYESAYFVDDTHLLIATRDQLTTWDLKTGGRMATRSRYLANAGVQIVNGDVIVMRYGKRGARNCYSPMFLDRWARGTPPADYDKAILGSLEPREGTLTFPLKGAGNVPLCLRGQLDIAKQKILRTDTSPYRWTDLNGENPVELVGSDSVSSSGAGRLGDYVIATSFTAKGTSAAVWGKGGKRVDLPIPLRDDEPVLWHGPAFALRGDGGVLAIGYGAHIFVYDPLTGAAIRTIHTTGLVDTLDFVGNDLIAGLDDHTTRRLDSHGDETARIAETIDIAAVSPNGKRLAVFGESGLVELWDAASLRKLVSFIERDGDNAWATLTPNGAFVGSDDAAELLSLTFANPPRAVPMTDYDSAFRKPTFVKNRLAGKQVDTAGSARRPPELELRGGPRIDGAKVRVQVHVESVSGGGDVVAYVDGRERTRRAYCGAKSDVTLELEMQASGRLTVAAFDTGGGTDMVANDVAITSTEKPRLWAVLVGIGTYSRLGPAWQLRADRDARGLERALRAMTGEGKLYASDANIVTLVNAQATRAAVDAALARLAKMKPGDQAIVYLAGHGWRLDNGNMVLVTSSTGTKAQAARQGISWQGIRDRLEAAPGRVLVLLDACHSGAFSQDLAVVNERLAGQLARRGRSGVVVFAAAKGHQYSYEVGASRGHFELAAEEQEKSPPKSKLATTKPPAQDTRADAIGDADTPAGLFTATLITALSSAATDRNRDGLIQLSELVDAVGARVSEQIATAGQQQTPNISHRDLFGDFAIGPRL